MKYNFDEIVNRWDTDSIKFDGPKAEGAKDYIPMWVADMDFKTPQPIINAIQEMLNSGILGYTHPNEEWSKTIQTWVKRRYNWTIAESDILFTPGIVRGLTFAINCFSEPEDSILMMSPVYPPFFNVPKINKRKIRFSQLTIKDAKYEIDFNKFEEDIKGCKIFILCNPHNPGGRVWSRDELLKIADICHKHRVLVVSDEIHADLTQPKYQHIPFASVSDKANDNCIVFMAPSKAFNMPGLASSYAIIPNAKIKEAYNEYINALDVVSGHMFSYKPLIAAYTMCDDWLEESLSYVEENINYVRDYLKEHMPLISMIEPQASFLIFLDCRNIKLSDDQLKEFFEKEAGLILNPGISFGPGGSGFMRLNIGCSKLILEKAMQQLYYAYQKLTSI